MTSREKISSQHRYEVRDRVRRVAPELYERYGALLVGSALAITWRAPKLTDREFARALELRAMRRWQS